MCDLEAYEKAPYPHSLVSLPLLAALEFFHSPQVLPQGPLKRTLFPQDRQHLTPAWGGG
jgi:hypothetical protein